MRFQLLVEGAVMLIGVYFIITQIVIPGFRNRPFFPILRHSPSATAERELAGAIERNDVKEIKRATKVVGSKQGE